MPLKPELGTLFRRGLARMRDAHEYDLARALDKSLSVIHPNQRRTGAESLKMFTKSTLEALNQHLVSVQRFVLETVESTLMTVTKDIAEELVNLVRGELYPELYCTRFEVYESAFTRHVAAYGAKMQLSDFRPDLKKAALQAGTSNRIRAFCDELGDALLIVVERQRNTMASPQKPREDVVDQANRFVKLEPNLFGIGFNINYLIRRMRGKKE